MGSISKQKKTPHLAHQIFDKLTRPNKINKKGFFESENTVETTT